MAETMDEKRRPLTFLQIKNLPEGMHAEGEVRGLYVRVADTGAISFVLRYMLGGRRRDMFLGSLNEYSLAEVREEARKWRQLLKQKLDPINERARRNAENQRVAGLREWSFERAAREVHKDLLPGFRNAKHGDQWINTLVTYAFPKIGPRPVGELDVAAMLDVLRPIWSTKEETARRVRQRLDAVMRWAVAHGYATTNPVTAASELLPKQRDKVDHHRALPVADAPAFYCRLTDAEGMGARCLQFVMLTAARSGEARGATWAEIDLDAAIWSIPAERMKADRPHWVPLSTVAVSLLSSLKANEPDPGDLVFPANHGGSLSDMTLTAVLRRMKVDATAHGMRSTFRDWASERGVSREIAERALAHAVQDKTEAAYSRSQLIEQRRPVMEAWAGHLTGAQDGANVIRIGGQSKTAA